MWGHMGFSSSLAVMRAVSVSGISSGVVSSAGAACGAASSVRLLSAVSSGVSGYTFSGTT